MIESSPVPPGWEAWRVGLAVTWTLTTAFGFLERFCWKTVMCRLEVGGTSVRRRKNCQVPWWHKWTATYLSTGYSGPVFSAPGDLLLKPGV